MNANITEWLVDVFKNTVDQFVTLCVEWYEMMFVLRFVGNCFKVFKHPEVNSSLHQRPVAYLCNLDSAAEINQR